MPALNVTEYRAPKGYTHTPEDTPRICPNCKADLTIEGAILTIWTEHFEAYTRLAEEGPQQVIVSMETEGTEPVNLHHSCLTCGQELFYSHEWW